MKILGDYHTHTTFSHGKGSVIENALSAKEKGLTEIAIADHGFGHLLYGMKRKDLPTLKQQILKAQEETGIKIYLGVEANFTSLEGDIDITEKDLENIEVLLVGHHRFVKSSIKDKFKFFIPNMLGIKSKKQIERNTNAICLAMDKHPIDVLTHLKHGIAIDLERIAKKAVETNTYIELNASKMLFTKKELLMMVRLGVKFVINTDAHKPQKVGVAENVIKTLEEYGVPLDSVANLNGVPKFKRVKR
ncbi:MAG: PHP domain-containing protein [Clostridia bacterium]|nr:PHP domain-containing protein [Clostridia bacterium]